MIYLVQYSNSKINGAIDIFVDGVNVTDEIAYNISDEENISVLYSK